jgi:hypothetical protein
MRDYDESSEELEGKYDFKQEKKQGNRFWKVKEEQNQWKKHNYHKEISHSN